MKLIGIGGTNGSGKDTVGQLLAEKHGFMFVSASDLLRNECRRRGLPVERVNLRAISAEWRRAGGLGVLVDKAIELFKNDSQSHAGLVIASLRNPGECERITEFGGTNVWVDADPKTRYERVQASSRGRDEEDDKTYEQFLAEEEAEMHSSGDVATLNSAAVKALAEHEIRNDTTLEDLNKQVDELVATLNS